MEHAQIVFGAATIGRAFPDAPSVRAALDELEQRGVRTVDTAQIYGTGAGPHGSERLLGEAQAGARGFVLDTKAEMSLGGNEDMASADNVFEGCEASLARLGVQQVDVFYLHAPAPSVPIASTLAGVDRAHKRGFFKRFGLSNYKPADVQAVHEHCAAHGYVLPSVYQGNYNAVARLQEATLFPLLRRLGMAFYAYSPIAGGFLTKSKEQVLGGAGRFDVATPLGKMYSDMYARPALLEALEEWGAIADDVEGCPRAELAYRWTRFHGALSGDEGDAVIFGASSLEQLRQTIDALNRGPLKAESVERINGIWDKIKDVAPLDNINR